jgi:hypothetical protein
VLLLVLVVLAAQQQQQQQQRSRSFTSMQHLLMLLQHLLLDASASLIQVRLHCQTHHLQHAKQHSLAYAFCGLYHLVLITIDKCAKCDAL